jgi:hypothetical protein
VSCPPGLSLIRDFCPQGRIQRAYARGKLPHVSFSNADIWHRGENGRLPRNNPIVPNNHAPSYGISLKHKPFVVIRGSALRCGRIIIFFSITSLELDVTCRYVFRSITELRYHHRGAGCCFDCFARAGLCLYYLSITLTENLREK